MVGNQFHEWVADWYGPYAINPGESPKDPTGPVDNDCGRAS